MTDKRLDSLALHGFDPQAVFGSATDVTPALHLSTIYRREADGSYQGDYAYTRVRNPNRLALEQTLAALEGGVDCMSFASGSAASMAVFQALQTGDHVVCAQDTYHGTASILKKIMARWGLAATFVDATDAAAVERAMRPETRLVWIETPSNPVLKVSDIERLAEIAHRGGALLLADNTVATPVLQRPLALGCDLVLHSTTKYVSGHSDVLGGAVVAREKGQMLDRIREIQTYGGGVPSPFDCWLSLRGVKTLPHRVRAQSANALAIARFLATHRHVEAVHYPGLEFHPQHALAARQMQAFGGLLSFQVKGGEKEALAVAAHVALITRATSLGGVESTIEQRASMEEPGTTTPPNLLRLSVGLEDVRDLIADLDQALSRALG